MRKEYRIKVEELNNGSIGYIPQVGTLKLQIGRLSCKPWEHWQNLYLQTDDYVQCSSNMEQSFFTEEAARLIIDRYKKQLEDEFALQVKKTTYINL
jgi:hypothetical protein